MNFDKKHSRNVLENQSRLQNSSYTTRKSLLFSVLCALFEQIPSGINRDILKKILPDAELKIVTNFIHLVIWSRGFPTLKLDLTTIFTLSIRTPQLLVATPSAPPPPPPPHTHTHTHTHSLVDRRVDS